jgi:pSer/pThr/pTyr-binding forkhead associated (FHA) protein
MKIIVFYSEKQNKVNDINLTLATAINGEYIVGRSRQSGIVLDSSDVSRQHGKFFLQNEDYYYSDLGSANGSLINNKLAKKNQSYLLKAGDVIRIGEFFLIMEAISEEIEALPATVLSSDWQSFAKVDTRGEVAAQTPEAASELPEVMAQTPQAVSEVPELVTSEFEPLTPGTEELSQGFKVISVHAPDEAESEEMIDVQTSEEFEEVVVVEATTQQAAEELAEVPKQ